MGLGLGLVAWGIVRKAEETTAMKDFLGLAFGVEGFGARRFGGYVYTLVYVYDGPGPGVSAGRVEPVKNSCRVSCWYSQPRAFRLVELGVQFMYHCT